MTSSENFKPGLFAIGLNFEKPSHNILEIELKVLTRHIERKPIYLKPVLCNLKAVLSFQMEFCKMKACSMLEEFILEYPRDLNILADLIYVYQKMDRESDSDTYKKQLESLKDDPLLQARCILGQAHALIYDLADDNTPSPTSLLKDIRRQLDMKNRHLEQVNKANETVANAFKVFKTIPEKYYDRQIDFRESAVKKFEEGIKMLKNCSKEELLVWTYDSGMARASLDKWRKKRGDSTSSRSENCIKTLEAHLDVTEMFAQIQPLDEPLKRYVAKSSIIFAQFYLSSRDCIEPANPPIRIKNQDLDSLWRKALSISPDCPSILQRCGRYDYVKKNYMGAIKLFDKSIKINPDVDTNWMTYAFRMEAYYLYVLQLKRNKSDVKQINYLELAYNDGKKCLQSKCKIFTMHRMAQICFQRAIPDNESSITFHCQHKNFIYEAVEILHKALNSPGVTNDGLIYHELGRCNMYIGKFRKAVGNLETSLELSKWPEKFPRAFFDLCRCFMAFYIRENDKNLLTEFRFMLKEAKKRHCNKWVTNAFNMMRRDNHKMLTDLIQNMIEFDVRGCDMLIDEALYKSYDQNQPESRRICQKLGREFETKLQERDAQESEINGPLEIQKSLSTENFQYDFFVSHSENDKDWVNCMLRPQLEEIDEEIKFKGCIPSRDFLPGEKKIDSMVKGIKQSCKLLIVLTKCYLEDVWQKYYSDVMIISAIDTKEKEKTIILIILEECEIPDNLKPFTKVYFTEISDWEWLRSSLTMNMDSEMGLGERNPPPTTPD